MVIAFLSSVLIGLVVGFFVVSIIMLIRSFFVNTSTKNIPVICPVSGSECPKEPDLYGQCSQCSIFGGERCAEKN